jgi:hypothetical protein
VKATLDSAQIQEAERNSTQAEARRRRLLKVALLLCIFGLLFLRDPKCITQPSFYAEDGNVLYREEVVMGPAAVWQTTVRYLIIAPRLLALIGAALPAAVSPVAFAIESILVAGVCCWAFSLEHFRVLLRSDALRTTLCLVAACGLPEQEVIGHLADVQWFLMLIAAPLTLAIPEVRRIASRVLLACLGLLISLSGPATILLVPLIGLRAVRTRRLDDFSMGIMAGTVLEWVIIARHWHTGVAHAGIVDAANSLVFSTLVAFANQIVLLCLAGRPVTQRIWTHDYGGFSLMAVVAFVWLLVLLYRAGTREYKNKARIMIYLIFSSLVVAMLRGMEATYPKMSSVQPFGAHRYFLLACWSFAFLLLAAIADRKAAWPAQKQVALAVVIFLFGAIGNFRIFSHSIPGWQKKYAPEIQAWQADRRAGREHAEVVVPISPPGWVIELPQLAQKPAK